MLEKCDGHLWHGVVSSTKGFIWAETADISKTPLNPSKSSWTEPCPWKVWKKWGKRSKGEDESPVLNDFRN